MEPNGYEVLSATNYLDKLPNMALKKDNQIYFILVEGAIAPNQPALDPQRKAVLLQQALKFDAICYYASVAFGSHDEDRFNASLALKGDEYYSNYIGLQLVEGVNPEELITELFPHLDPTASGIPSGSPFPGCRNNCRTPWECEPSGKRHFIDQWNTSLRLLCSILSSRETLPVPGARSRRGNQCLDFEH